MMCRKSDLFLFRFQKKKSSVEKEWQREEKSSNEARKYRNEKRKSIANQHTHEKVGAL